MSMNAPPSVADAKSSAKNKYAKDTINASLRYGIKLVETLHSELLHDETICSCEPCSWVRDAQRLTEEFEQHLEPNPYRPAH